jgi:hypothetical protein
MKETTKKKILIASLLASFCTHVIALTFFHRYSLLFSTIQHKQGLNVSSLEKLEKDQILKEAFETPLPGVGRNTSPPKKQNEQSSFQAKSPFIEPFGKSIPSQFVFPFPEDSLASSPAFVPQFSIPSVEPFNLLSYLPNDWKPPITEELKERQWRPQVLPSISALQRETPKSPEVAPPEITFSIPDTPVEIPDNRAQGASIRPHQFPNLPKLPSLSELNTVSLSDQFEADLIFLPKEEGEGYIFALTLIPNPVLEFPKFRQHFTFLIDRSNSVQQSRLDATKNAIHSSLKELSPGDTFNIVCFDSKIEKLAPNPLQANAESFETAKKFLEKIQLGSFFSTSDLYKPLFLTVPSTVSDDEIHTAILLTDGESLSKKALQQSFFSNWTFYNAGRVSLFPLCLDSDKHLPMLETTASFNKGKLASATSNRGLKRKLLKLIRSIHQPIAKNITCRAISRVPKTKIELYPTPLQATHLYLDQPYVIMGETRSLDDFIIFIQGQLVDRWVNIKKTVSFLNGKKGTKSLKSEWALQKANSLYERFLFDQNPQHIADAKLILEPHEKRVAFK